MLARKSLLAHVGKKVALGLGRLLGDLLCLEDLCLGLLQFGDVRQPPREAGLALEVGVHERHEDVPDLPVRRVHPGLDVPNHALSLHGSNDGPPILRIYVGAFSPRSGLHSRNLSVARIGEADHSVDRDRDPHGGGVQDPLEELPLGCQGRLGPFALGDVDHRGDQHLHPAGLERVGGDLHIENPAILVAVGTLESDHAAAGLQLVVQRLKVLELVVRVPVRHPQGEKFLVGVAEVAKRGLVGIHD